MHYDAVGLVFGQIMLFVDLRAENNTSKRKTQWLCAIESLCNGEHLGVVVCDCMQTMLTV